MSFQSFARPVAALALMVAIGLPAHAGDNKAAFCPTVTTQCAPAPVKCDPAPVKCPTPPCNPAVPEPASVALVAVGAVALLPLGMRALKTRRQIG